MEEKISIQLKALFEDNKMPQKEIADILKITQAGVSKKIRACNFTIAEIIEISKEKRFDLFSQLSVLLPEKYRNKYNDKSSLSDIEEAILTLVKNNVK